MPKAAARVKEAFLEMDRRNRAAISHGRDIDRAGISEVIESCVNDPRLRLLFIAALSEFIGVALDGTVVDLSTWDPFK